MSDIRDPSTDQPLPIPNDGPSCHDLVIEDLKKRKEFGLRKYGSPLQPNNGRSMLQDAYEEVLDLAAYLRGKIEEEKAASPDHSCSCHARDRGPCVICKELGCEVWDFNQYALPIFS